MTVQVMFRCIFCGNTFRSVKECNDCEKRHTMKRNMKPNTMIQLYENDVTITYDCVGVEQCMYAICAMMPPDGTEECTYSEHNTCNNIDARLASIKVLQTKAMAEAKRIEKHMNDGW